VNPVYNCLLVSTYELGHQPFGLAEPAAVLRQIGAVVETLDLAVEGLDEAAFRRADLIAFYVPMHTATRLAAQLIAKVRGWNPTAHVAAYGLYAPMNEIYLRHLGVQTVLGGEFEDGLAALAQRLARGVEAAPGEQLEPRVSVAPRISSSRIVTGFLPSIVTPICAYRTEMGGRLVMWRRAAVASTGAGTAR
jgi:hypothetical protein